MTASTQGGDDGTSEADRLLREAEPHRLPNRNLDLERERTKDDLKLRRRVANGALVVMLLQMATADVAFYWYGIANDWDVPGTAISVWLTATVVQVVSVVLVITRYLFPAKSGGLEQP